MPFGPYVLLNHFCVHEYNVTKDILNWLEKFLDKIQEIWSVKKNELLFLALKLFVMTIFWPVALYWRYKLDDYGGKCVIKCSGVWYTNKTCISSTYIKLLQTTT